MRIRPRVEDDLYDYVALEITPGPEPFSHGAGDPAFIRRPVGFRPPVLEREPLLWEGD